MSSSSRTRNLTAIGVVVLGVFAFSLAGPSGILTVTVDQSETEMVAGGRLSGVATSEGEHFVNVKMYVDGELVEEDDQMEGGSNIFDLGIPGDAAGKNIRLVATDSCGNVVERRYRVQS